MKSKGGFSFPHHLLSETALYFSSSSSSSSSVFIMTTDKTQMKLQILETSEL